MDEARRVLLLQRFAEAMALCEHEPAPDDIARAKSICATPTERTADPQQELPLPVP